MIILYCQNVIYSYQKGKFRIELNINAFLSNLLRIMVLSNIFEIKVII